MENKIPKDALNSIFEAMDYQARRSKVHPMDRFLNAVSHYDHFSGYFTRKDRDEGNCDLEGMKKIFGGWSHQTQIMAAFFVYIFTRKNVFNFDYIDAVTYLDLNHLHVILDWGSDPYWP